ncbi:MAG: phage tail tape measure protein [Chloroflexi bacterium]|nr:phage tail tape measure protein [Chloroflexota bacterium]
MARGNMGDLVAYLRLEDKKFVTGLKKAELRVNKLGASAQRIGRSLSVGLSLPLAAAGGASVKLATDFDRSMTKIETLVGRSKSQVDAWREDLVAMGPALGKTPQELSDALFFITSAGIENAKALDVLSKSAKASAVGLGETKVVADAVVSAMTAWKQQGLSAAEATDVLTATVRYGKLEAADLAAVLGRVTSTAAEMGVSFAEVGGFIAAFSRTGANAEIAATSLRGTLNTFLKPGEEALKVFDDLDISIDDVRKAIREDGLSVALFELIEGFDGNLDVLGDVIPNVRALAGVLSAARSQGISYVAIAKMIAESEGMMERAFDRTRQTFAFQFDVFVAKASAMGVAIGNILMPKVLKLTTHIGDYITKLTDAGRENLVMAVTAGAIAIALGPVLWSLGIFTKTIGLLAFSWLPKAAAAIITLRKALTSLNIVAAIAAGLWGLVAGLVAAAVAAAGFATTVLLVDDKKFRDFLRSIPMIGESLDWARVKVETFVLELKKVGVVAHALVEPFWTWAKSIGRVFTSVGVFIAEAFEKVFGSISVNAESLFRTLFPGASMLLDVYGFVAEKVSDVWSDVSAQVHDELQSIESEIASLNEEFETFWAKQKIAAAEVQKIRMLEVLGLGDTLPEDMRSQTGSALKQELEEIVKGFNLEPGHLGSSMGPGGAADPSKEILAQSDRMKTFFRDVKRSIEDALDLSPAQKFNREIERGIEEVTKMHKELSAGGEKGQAQLDALANSLGLYDSKLSTFIEHYKKGMGELDAATEKAGKAIRLNLGESISSTIDEMFTGFLRGTRDLESFTEIWANSMIGIVENMFSQFIKSKLNFDAIFEKNFMEDLLPTVKDFATQAMSAIGRVFGFGGFDSTSLGDLKNPAIANMDFSSRAASIDSLGLSGLVPGHAKGGITTGPQLAVVGDNPSGREAIIPLERWQEVMGGSGDAAPEIHIHSPSALQSQRSGRDTNGRKFLELIFEGAKGAVADDIVRGGSVGRAISATFGSQPTGGV